MNLASPEQENSPAVLLAAAVTVVCWASAFVVIRGVGAHYSPGAMALLRLAVGSVALGVIAVVNGVRLPPRRSWPLLIVWAIGWYAGYNLALNQAERQIDAGTAAMLVNIAPLLVVLVGGLLGEGFPKQLVIGAPISFLGVVLIASASWTGQVAWGGVGLGLVAACLYAAATLTQKRLLKSVDSTTLTWLGCVVGALVLLPWLGTLLREVAVAPRAATVGVLYLAIFPTAIAFSTWAYVLQRSSAGRTAATTYVVPAVAIGLSWLLLGEVPTPVMLLGGVLCLLGVFVTRLHPRPKVSSNRA